MEFLKDVLGDELFNQVSEKLKGHEKDLKSERLHSREQLAVAKSGARSEKALMGMMDLDKLTLDDNGDVKGLDEQIEAIKKDSAFLFTPDPKPAKDVDLGGGHNDPAPAKDVESIADYYKK